MKVFKYIAFLLLIAIIGTAIYISVQPNTFEVSRTRTMKAPAAVIYNNVIDFKNWKDWSSWVEADPNMKITYPNQTKGVGGSYTWEDKDGVGTMKTMEAIANAFIKQQMQIAEFPASDITWVFQPNNDGSTDVTWTISGKDLPFGFKAYNVFTGGMDKQIGPHYERSLEKLDSIVVAEMKKYSITVNGITNHSGGYYLYNTTSCKISELESKIDDMLPKVIAYAKKNHINIAGTPFINYMKWDEENNAVIFSCCIPTAEQVITAEGDDIITGKMESFKAVKTTLKGNYSHLKEAWETAMAYIPKNGLEFAENGPMIETYLNDPTNTPNPADLLTEIYIAVKEKDTIE
ncbi:GyrI-like domain-containing protein [Mariniflexile gromovii]|uniref:GyrI-like domain-containing protein n=1 Tax=Mariniflexile gromovii TaxID=362523 RepID=A0ABS4BY74_9FLAO|nr:GyrI-like domain-containing protein [Mariniflexile gromovii]MBP0905534.1 GyrI-like domain-containing protein [Mariniflexile gromovii]